MKQVARIVIGTHRNRYQFTIPNIDLEQARALIAQARVDARAANVAEREAVGGDYSQLPIAYLQLLFNFVNEFVEINEEPEFIHVYIKEENYAFDTPDIRVTTHY